MSAVSANMQGILTDLPDLLTVKELANILRVTPNTVKRWEKSGRITAIKISTRGDRRFRRDTILKFILG